MYTCVCMQTDTHTHADFLNGRYAHISFHLVREYLHEICQVLRFEVITASVCMHVVQHGNLVQHTHNAKIGWTCLIRYLKHLIISNQLRLTLKTHPYKLMCVVISFYSQAAAHTENTNVLM